MASTTKPARMPRALPQEVKKALAVAVAKHKSQRLVGDLVGVSTTVVSQLLNDKYPGDVAAMEQRIRGQFMAETVTCPVMGKLSKRDCLDNQGLPMAFTNPVRAALGRACKTCPNRKEHA